jgi:hypothetical protein
MKMNPWRLAKGSIGKKWKRGERIRPHFSSTIRRFRAPIGCPNRGLSTRLSPVETDTSSGATTKAAPGAPFGGCAKL